MNGLYTTGQAATLATTWRRQLSAGAAAVTSATVRKWASRGHLNHTGLDDHGHPLYAHLDLARAEKATRGRALRLVGIGAQAAPQTHDEAPVRSPLAGASSCHRSVTSTPPSPARAAS